MRYSRILDAANWAAILHKDQKRKGSGREPYINHLLEVAKLVSDCEIMYAYLQEQTVIAALLHDAVEDQNVSLTTISERFGSNVAFIVRELTDNKTLSKEERKLAQIKRAPDITYMAKVIKLADKISNLNSIIRDPPEGWDNERIVAYIDWASQVKAAVISNGTVNESLEHEFDETARKARIKYDPRRRPRRAKADVRDDDEHLRDERLVSD